MKICTDSKHVCRILTYADVCYRYLSTGSVQNLSVNTLYMYGHKYKQFTYVSLCFSHSLLCCLTLQIMSCLYEIHIYFYLHTNYMYMYICICICIWYVCMYMYICLTIRININTNTYSNDSICMYVYVLYVYTYVNIICQI